MVQVSGSWSRRRFIPELPDYNDPTQATHTVSAAADDSANRTNRLGGSYSFDYDFQRDYFLQQRIQGYYNAQCCGVVVEFQTFNFQGVQGVVGAPGQALQHLFQPRRHRDVLELPRGPRWRRAAPLTSLSR